MSTGIMLNEQQHEEELKKYNEAMNSKKRAIFEGGATVKQIIDKLEEVDEVVVLLGSNVLRVCKDLTYYYNEAGYKVQATSEEPGQEYMVDYDTKKWVDVKPNWVFPEPRKALRTVPVYTNIPISNAFTGRQAFIKILEKYLD